MRLNHLTIDNFKGITHFEMMLGGGNVNVYGDNATGKTTIADAVMWLLFDKDTDGRKNFSIKPLDAQGNSNARGIEVSVQGDFALDGGRSLTLRKVYRENWTRKRGSVNEELTGHTTDYFVDEMPTPAKKYAELIDSIVPMHLVPILTDPLYFARMPWKERREILLDAAGAISDAEVAAGNEAFEAVLQSGKSIEDTIAHWQVSRKKANEELSKIPARLDELSSMLQDVPEDVEFLSIQADVLRKKIERLRNPDSDTQKDYRDAQIALLTVKTELSDLERQENERMEKERSAARAMIQPLLQERAELENHLMLMQRSLFSAKEKMQMKIEQCDILRAEFDEVASLEWAEEGTCPTCGQAMPAEMVVESHNRFRDEKNVRLDRIELRGRAARDEAKKAELEAKDLQIEITRTEKALLDVRAKIDAVTVQEPVHEPEYADKVNALMQRVEAAQAVVDELGRIERTSRADAAQQIRDAFDELGRIERMLQAPAYNERIEARMDELTQRRRELGDMLAKADCMIQAAEDFAREKCRMMQERIDAMFHNVTWRLWRDQLNGGMADCCDALIGGVPFEDANNAAKINAGLEIIGVLSTYYGKELPVLVDNAEAVTNLYCKPEVQIIRLIVSEVYNTLHVEKEDAYESETERTHRDPAA